MSYIDDFIYRVRTGRLFSGLQKPKETTPFSQANLPDLPPVEEKKPIGPDQIIHFLFMGKTYFVESFNLNFKQDVDSRKNRPDSFTYGGTLQITLSETPDHSINEWMAQTYMMRNGEIQFFRNLPKITQSSLLTLFFEDAYCVAYSKKMDTITSGLLTTLTISPRKIKIGNEEFENNWKKKESLSHTIKSI
ncbi:hypothetical protein AGMMS50239_06920 [Bacteroidia bacterium]|nr:hypothetical protein AGMMS50239_06920 [Bacteroidia bacterium]GHV30201.1 hypothetical protein FACS1894177_02390 [Bacteroidia bacterium]